MSEQDEKLEASRSWLAQGEERLAANDFEGAISFARQGLSVLGEDYASHDVVDDTYLKIAAADEQIENGHLENGASTLLRMLKTRTDLYAESRGMKSRS